MPFAFRIRFWRGCEFSGSLFGFACNMFLYWVVLCSMLYVRGNFVVLFLIWGMCYGCLVVMVF